MVLFENQKKLNFTDSLTDLIYRIAIKIRGKQIITLTEDLADDKS
jgi:hypothetical protein